MPTVALDLLGESYESRTKPLEFQRTVNFYPELTSSGKGGLMSFPGTVSVVPDLASNSDRGLYDFEGTTVQVLAQGFYTVNLTLGTRTLIGEILGSARCTFSSNAGLLVIANGSGLIYQYNGSTLSQITDSDLESPYFAAHINNQWIYSNNKTTGRWVSSNAGAPDLVDGLNYATAESNGDILIRPYVFRQQLLLFGKRTIEPWWNTGTGTPPFDRQEGGIIEKGLGADYSIAHSDEALYFLGDDLRVYQYLSNQLDPISTDGLWSKFSSYSTHSDAIGAVITVGNQDIYILQFPSVGETWAYSQQKRFWFQLSSGTAYGKFNYSSFMQTGGRTYIASFAGGIYELSYANYQDNGSTLVRERITRSFDSEFFGVSGRPVFWNSIEIRCTVGEGLNSGQGSNPQIILQYSDDDGRTWDNEYYLSLGRLGDYHKRPMLFGLGSAWRRKWRIRVTDPVNFNLFEIKANVELGID